MPSEFSEDAQPCAGCGNLEDVHHPHPWVGVTRDEDGKFAAFPVCETCHRIPENRKYKLKMHFFERKMAAVAVAQAGSSDIRG